MISVLIVWAALSAVSIALYINVNARKSRAQTIALIAAFPALYLALRYVLKDSGWYIR